MGARIFSIADTMDAMMSDRPYRQGRPYAVARAEIQHESGRQFDPQVVATFLAISEETWVAVRREAARMPSERIRQSAGDLTLEAMGQSDGGIQ